MPECAMGFCDEPAVAAAKAFDNDDSRWWCEDHMEVVAANIETDRNDEMSEDSDSPNSQWDDYVNNRGPVWGKNQDQPVPEPDGVTCHWCHKNCGGTCLGVNDSGGPRQMKPSDPAYFLLKDGHTSTPEVHRDGCYICEDPEFAQMGLPLCKPCPRCSAKANAPAGHVPADDVSCDDCGLDLQVYWQDCNQDLAAYERLEAG